MNIPNHESRPFGILSNASPLSFHLGKEFYPTVDHRLLSSFLRSETDRAQVLSYATLADARRVFNRLDEAQFLAIVETACDRYLEKAVRKSKELRERIRSDRSALFVCRDAPLLRTILGVSEDHGYNLLGKCVGRIRRHLEKIPEDLMIGFLPDRDTIQPIPRKMHRLDLKDRPTDPVDETKIFYPEIRQEYDPEHPEMEEYDPEHPEMDEVHAVFDPYEELPHEKQMKWRYAPIGHLIDDLNYGAVDNVVEDAAAVDPFDAKLIPLIDPLIVYKIFKTTEFLVQSIQKGMDILHFATQSIDAILFEGKVCPEIFGGILSPALRRQIYIETWEKYKAGTLEYLPLVQKEIDYPGNLVAFVRKYYLHHINQAIGNHINEILFRGFLKQVFIESYPEIGPPWLDIMLQREWKTFTVAEYQQITNQLYHLFFQNKFHLSVEDDIRLKLHEFQRKSLEQIDEAGRFIPVIHDPTASDVSDLLSTTFDLRIDGRTFQDLYQWIYFSLFQVYGDLSPKDAYPLVRDVRLQERLDVLIQSKRHRLIAEALRVKFRTYPQIREMLTYLEVTGLSIRFEDDPDLMASWNQVAKQDIDSSSRQLMAFVVALIPDSPRHFEKCIFLYSFLLDFFRSIRIFQTLHGERLDARAFSIFIRCFYPSLLALPPGSIDPPPEFIALVTSMRYVKDVPAVWRVLAPYIGYFLDPEFVPGLLFEKAKEEMRVEDRLTTAMETLIHTVQCLYDPETEITNEHLFRLVQILGGRDDIVPWMDPSFDMVMERSTNPDPPEYHKLPKEIRDRLPKKKKARTKEVIVSYHFIHPRLQPHAETIKTLLGRASIHDVLVSRLSFAIAELHKNAINTRRLRFFLKK